MEIPPFPPRANISTSSAARPLTPPRSNGQAVANEQLSSSPPPQNQQGPVQENTQNPNVAAPRNTRNIPQASALDQSRSTTEASILEAITLENTVLATEEVVNEFNTFDSLEIEATATLLDRTQRAIESEAPNASSNEESRLVIEQNRTLATRTFLSIANPQNEFRLIDLYV